MSVSITIKNIPESLHIDLKRQAQNHQRSLSKEILFILEEHSASNKDDISTHQLFEKIDELNKEIKGPLTLKEIDSAINWGRK